MENFSFVFFLGVGLVGGIGWDDGRSLIAEKGLAALSVRVKHRRASWLP